MRAPLSWMERKDHISQPCSMSLNKVRWWRSVAPGVADDGEKADRQADQLFRPMRGVGVEEQGVARLHMMNGVAMAVGHFAFEDVDQLQPRMLEDREDIGIIAQADDIRLHHHRPMRRVAKQFVLVTGAGAAPFDLQPLPAFDEGRVARAFIPAEQRSERHVQGDGEGLQRPQRGRCRAVFDPRKHSS